MLELKKPISFFDIESTGLEIGKDKIIEISIVKLNIDGSRDTYYQKFHPGSVPISDGALGKHGINIEDLRGEPSFKEKAQEIFDFIKDTDLGGYNAHKFDIPMLADEFIQCGILYNPRGSSIIDPLAIYSKMEPRNLETAYKYYTGKTLVGAHGATADINATIDIFEAQINKYDALANLTVTEISNLTLDANKNVDLAGKFQKTDDGNIIITFGKYKGKSVGEVFKADAKYIDWMSTADGFTADTKIIAKKIVAKLKSM